MQARACRVFRLQHTAALRLGGIHGKRGKLHHRVASMAGGIHGIHGKRGKLHHTHATCKSFKVCSGRT